MAGHQQGGEGYAHANLSPYRWTLRKYTPSTLAPITWVRAKLEGKLKGFSKGK